MAEGRVATFRSLKPPCVALSRVVLAYKSERALGGEVVQALRALLKVLEGVDELDVKLADYAFFPLSYVFRDAATLPSQPLELSLRCLDILIRKGWNLASDPDLCKQLLVLLSFLFGKPAVRESNEAHFTELITASALNCFTSLVENAATLFLRFCRISFNETAPIMGHAINSVLTALNDDSSYKCQLAAAETISATVSCLKHEKILHAFLPGIISNLTQAVKSTTRSIKPSKFLVKVLYALESIMGDTLGDQFQAAEGSDEHSTAAVDKHTSWTQASSGQVRLALANIVRLRYHEKEVVRKALYCLCTTILQRCKVTLQESADILLETAVVLCSRNTEVEWQTEIQNLEQMISVDGNLIDLLKRMLHSLLLTLPVTVQSRDPGKLRTQTLLIITAYGISARIGVDLDIIEDTLLSSLQGSAKILLQNPPAQSIKIASGAFEARELHLISTSKVNEMLKFRPISLVQGDGTVQLDDLQDLVGALSLYKLQSSLKRRLVDNLDLASPDESMASMWLLTRLMGPRNGPEAENFLSLLDNSDANDEDVSQTAYSNALEVISTSPIEKRYNWQYQAVALEVIALHARRQMSDFRPELVDNLFPIIERIGVLEPDLQQHAFTCLNILAHACGASSAADLIVQNVDYLLNSLAIKLSAFDISPLAPRVLVMMVELCGPRLIPYLDDILDSTYNALAMFHGYPRLVDGLFSVLESIVQQAVGSLPVTIEGPQKESYTPVTIDEVVILVKNLVQSSESDSLNCTKAQNVGENMILPLCEPVSIDTDRENSNIEEQEKESHSGNETSQPSKSYRIIQSIVRLSQHYLTHPSSTFRQRLLVLSKTGFEILSRNEDEFLPLINDIWPVTLRRLFDPAPDVGIAAMETMCAIFKFAGDFVSSRVEDEWPSIKGLGHDTYVQLASENKGKGGRGVFTPAGRTWEGLVELFSSIAKNVRITAEMEDDVIELLEPSSRVRPDLRAALETLNGDALWLIQKRHGQDDKSVPNQLLTPDSLGPSFTVIENSRF